MSEAAAVDSAHYRHYVGGRFVDAASGATFDVVTRRPRRWLRRPPAETVRTSVSRWAPRKTPSRPATGLARGRPSVARSCSGPPTWSRRRSAEIQRLQTLEMGAPLGPELPGPHPLVTRSAWNLRFFAEEQEQAGDPRVQPRRLAADLHDQRRGGGFRADHPVERSGHALDLEDGALPGLRQLRGAQAVRVVAVVDEFGLRDL